MDEAGHVYTDRPVLWTKELFQYNYLKKYKKKDKVGSLSSKRIKKVCISNLKIR